MLIVLSMVKNWPTVKREEAGSREPALRRADGLFLIKLYLMSGRRLPRASLTRE